jgi:predicted nucleic acid-binding protein
VARRSAGLRARLRTLGKTRTQADMLIAATAAEHDLILVTRNVRDFDDCGLQVLNPFAD